jgi:hypothetical protein
MTVVGRKAKAGVSYARLGRTAHSSRGSAICANALSISERKASTALIDALRSKFGRPELVERFVAARATRRRTPARAAPNPERRARHRGWRTARRKPDGGAGQGGLVRRPGVQAPRRRARPHPAPREARRRAQGASSPRPAQRDRHRRLPRRPARRAADGHGARARAARALRIPDHHDPRNRKPRSPLSGNRGFQSVFSPDRCRQWRERVRKVWLRGGDTRRGQRLFRCRLRPA